MKNSLGSIAKQGMKALVALSVVGMFFVFVGQSGEGRSYNIQRMGLAYLPGDSVSKNGYACGYGEFVYISKGDTYAIVDVSVPGNPQVRGYYRPRTNPSEPYFLRACS